MDIGRPKRIIEIEPISIPVPEPAFPAPTEPAPIEPMPREPSPDPREPVDP
jgi:hypothetical protein